jgi:hypothetical protein
MIVAAAKWCFYPSGDSKRWDDSADPYWILPSERGLNSGKEGGVEDKEYVSHVLNEEIFRRRREFVKGPAACMSSSFLLSPFPRLGPFPRRR